MLGHTLKCTSKAVICQPSIVFPEGSVSRSLSLPFALSVSLSLIYLDDCLLQPQGTIATTKSITSYSTLLLPI